MITIVHSLIIIFTMFSAVVCGQAQENKTAFLDEFYLDDGLRSLLPSQHLHAPALITFPAKQVDTSQDVLTYELYLDWVMPLLTRADLRPLRKFEGIVSSSVLVLEPSDTIKWNARGLMIDSILVDGVNATWTVQSGVLGIVPGVRIPAGDTIRVDAFYAGLSDARGFVALADSDAKALGLLHPIAYTMSEPEDARRWYPCHDTPTDKALFTIHVRVPIGFTVVSNGTLQDSIQDTDTTSWQTWQHAEPMPTYLVTVNASIYTRYVQEYRGDQTIPIYNFHWPEDQNGVVYSAQRALQNIPKMFEAFVPRLGPYPWDTYGHVTISPFQFGGMEHQSMSTINRRWLIGDVEVGYAHELGHQWLGDAVTCATWADIWLNEGGASFTEALWREWNEGPSGYRSQLLGRRSKYLEKGLAEPPVYGIPITNLFNEGTTYCKSAWIFHMMRRLSGDSAFFPMLKNWVTLNMHQSRQTYELLEHVQLSMPGGPVPWDIYFDQWLVKAGHPVFIVTATANESPTNGRYSTHVRVSQSQSGDNIPEVFLTPLTIRLFGISEVKDTTIFVDQNTVETTVYTSFAVDSCRLDPNDDVLCEQVVQFATSVEDTPQFSSQIIAPVPVRRGSPLYLSLPSNRVTTVRVCSVDGSIIAQTKFVGDAHLIDTHDWPIGVVVVIIESNGEFKTTKIPVIE